MYKDSLIAIVVPAHNEALFIGQVIKTMPDFVDHIVVVDDRSTDETVEAAVACKDSRVTVLTTAQNLGVGGATILGYLKALELQSQVIVKMDGDGQMTPEHLPALLDAIITQGYDYAKGNRFLAGVALEQMPLHRLLGNIVLTFMTKLASGYWQIFDPQNGYTAIRAETLKRLNLEAINQRYFFENDMLVNLNYQGFRVKDVAMPARYGAEQSNLNPLKIGVTFPILLTRRFIRRIYQKYILRDFSPIALFLILGLLLFLWGGAFGLYLWIMTSMTGRATPTGTIMLALLPLILGFQLLLQGIVLDIQQTPK